VGLIIKHGVLAVRLFANIMAGHTVIAVILGFIAQAAAPDVAAAYPWLFWVVTPASILGQIGVGLLELFVAFLQAYIFAFLSALFIGAAVHPH
jgi:F-type H+-transporting ATPase subunit a